MSANPFDHPFLSQLLGDAEVSHYFAVESDLRSMLEFELALARVSASFGIIPEDANDEIQERLIGFAPDIERLNHSVVNDGVVIPNLIAQMRALLTKKNAGYLHFGATSQDVIDSSLMMRMRDVLSIIECRLGDLVERLQTLELEHGETSMMGKTRMQAAIKMSVSDRLASWKNPLIALREEVAEKLLRGLPLQFGGAVGTLEKFLGDRQALRSSLARELGLADHAQWHSQRAAIVDLAHFLAKISGALGKIGQDVALMALEGQDIALSGGGASSAMPHKQNPVSAEILVAQARFAATLVSGSYQSLVHEQERSGAAWTLEWMIFPQLAVSCGASTLCAQRLLNGIVRLGARMDDGAI